MKLIATLFLSFGFAFLLRAQCNFPTRLECSQTLVGQGLSSNSSFSINDYGSCLSNSGNNFQGLDKLYDFVLTKGMDLSINLNPVFNGNSGNLALFLLDNCSPANCIAYNIDPGGSNSITSFLPAGHYYVVVENMDAGDATYDLELNCGCSCTPMYSHQLQCENFEQYNLNDSLSASSLRWQKWTSGAQDAVVVGSAGNQKIRLRSAPGYEPDVWTNLFSPIGITTISGRYRLSFTITVASGKAGNYLVLQNPPNSNGNNQIYGNRVVFYPNGTGSLVIGNPNNSPSASFTYQNGAPTDVMQIIDLNSNTVELWINHEFIYSGTFNLGGSGNLGSLGAVNFDAHPSNLNNTAFDYTIDDFCFKSQLVGWSICQALAVEQTTCIKNGQSYYAPLYATCDLYDTDLESQPCPGPCDNATWLECSQTLTYQGFDGVSNFSIPDYNGCLPNFTDVFLTQDRVYKFELKKPTEITLTLRQSSLGGGSGDLAIFLLDNCSPTHCIDFDASQGVYHTLTETLQPGMYYVVVEEQGYTAPFNIELSCGCNCFNLLNTLLHCETFESYLPDDLLSASSERWHVWDDPQQDVPVTEEFGNQSIRLMNSGSYEPDVWLDLFPTEIGAIVQGRYRLSFDMTVAPGKYGNYYVHHVAPDDNGNGRNIAYRVIFNPDGTGQLILGNPGNSPSASFVYVNGAPTNVMQILDLTADVAELWINHEFIYSWPFNIGDAFNVDWLADVNFDAHPGSLNGQDFDYTVDNLCFNAGNYYLCSLIDPIQQQTCLKNGKEYFAPVIAACDLYDADLESVPCEDICDYGGTLIYRGDTYSGNFDQSDLAPWLLRNDICVGAAYDAAPPLNLHSDIYVFYNESSDSIIVHFNNDGDPSTACFVFSCNWEPIFVANLTGDSTVAKSQICTREPHCIATIPSGANKNVDLVSCDNFYYIVVTGLPGATYSDLYVTPKGPCPRNPPEITCGATLNDTISGTPDPVFSTNVTAGIAYDHCYSGFRPYNGAEKFYKFTLNEAKRVTISLDATAEMGIFLYDFICGYNCINFAENTVFDPHTSMSSLLHEGTYYIVVDKATTAGPNNFALSMDCGDFSSFPNLNYVIDESYNNCPPDPGLVHQVGIYANALNFAPDDKIYFRYKDNSGQYVTSPNLTRTWGSSLQQIKYQPLDGDTSLIPDKCAFAIGDTFVITVFQSESGSDNYGEFYADYMPATSPGVSATNTYQNNGISLITHLRKGLTKNFVVTPSDFTVSDTSSVSQVLTITTNEAWTIEELPPVDWLTLTSSAGSYQTSVKMTFDPDTTELRRTTYLKVSLNSNPSLYTKYIKVIQKGICNPDPLLNVSATPSSVCGNQQVILKANVGTDLDNAFRYKWSTGDTLQSIKVYPAASTSYTVTITNIDCAATKTATKTVIVSTPPAQPINPVNRTICQGDMLTQPLAVSLPPGANLVVNWYDQPVNGNLVKSNSLTYSPPNLVTSTFYAETVNTGSQCVSAQRTPVTLTVNPVPDLTVSQQAFCAPDQTYSVSATTNGIDITANMGNVTFGNGTYTISQIPSGADVIITAHYSGTNVCTSSISFDGPICGCPPIAPPLATQASPVVACQGMTIPPLTVSVGPGLSVYWFDQPSGGSVLPGGSDNVSFQTGISGTYYAEARNTNNCTSTRTAITLNILPSPALGLVDTICHLSANGSTYSVQFSSSVSNPFVSAGQLSNLGGGMFLLDGIGLGTSVLITANSGTGCNKELLVQSPQCACPFVAPPLNPQDVTICQGQTPDPLHVDVAPGYQVYWFNQAFGGQPLPGGMNTPDFYPQFPGTYYAEARIAASGCPSGTRTPLHYAIEPQPQITIDTFICDTQDQVYDFYFSTDGDIILTSLGDPVDLGNGNYVFQAVPNGVDISLTSIFNSGNGCANDQLIHSPGCFCPPVATPVSLGDKVFCQGDNLPELKVTVNAGQQAEWYASSSSTQQPLATGNSFTPPAQGTYYVRAREIQSGCLSDVPLAITLSVIPPPIVLTGPDQTICEFDYVFLSGTVQGAGTGTWTSTIPGGTFSPNNGLNAVYYIPPGNAPQDFALVLTSSGAQAPCAERSDSILVHVNKQPTFEVDTFYCAANMQTGYFLFSSNALTVSNGSPYQMIPIAPQLYQITIPDIATYTTIALHLANFNCSINTIIPSNFLVCPCPSLSVPSAPDTVIYCAGDPPPVLQPIVAPGLVLKWYSNLMGGDPIFTGNAYPVPGQGVYYMLAFDSLTGCSTSRIPVSVVEHPKPVASTGQDLTICPGVATTLHADLTGINQIYQWSNGTSGPSAQVMPVQNTSYTLTVSAAGCSSTDNVEVSVWPAVDGVIDPLTEIKCFGDLTGSLKILPSGGVQPFKFLWNTGSMADQINDLAANTYAVTVTDLHNCADTVFYDLTQPADVILASSDIQIFPNCSGSIQVVMSGGVPPYKYLWQRDNVDLMDLNNMDYVTDLLPGTYVVKVTDQNGCAFGSGPFEIGCVSVKETDLQRLISISPNPTSGLLNVKFGLPSAQAADLTLRDVLGRQLLKQQMLIPGNQILTLDLNELPAAMYLLTVKMEKGSLTFRVFLQK